jgi:5-methylcytosine-specific restriction endonuclease McrA
MSEHIPGALARAVRDRAGNICEYCHLPQLLQEAAFHIDHISPRSGKGPSHADNLAFACVACSLKKAARTRALIGYPRSLSRFFILVTTGGAIIFADPAVS